MLMKSHAFVFVSPTHTGWSDMEAWLEVATARLSSLSSSINPTLPHPKLSKDARRSGVNLTTFILGNCIYVYAYVYVYVYVYVYIYIHIYM